jgi:CheY-like chemotaxis protein
MLSALVSFNQSLSCQPLPNHGAGGKYAGSCFPAEFSWENVRVIILIVEDNAAVRRLIRRAVAHLAQEIYECVDGADALKAYTDHQPDLVIMDVRMPRMDGLAATRLIKQNYPAARIVIVTDYDEEDLREAAVLAGAIGYSLKDDLTELEVLIAGLSTERK